MTEVDPLHLATECKAFMSHNVANSTTKRIETRSFRWRMIETVVQRPHP
jgi:hypothetical protein